MHRAIKRKPTTLKEALSGRIPDEAIPLVPRAYDAVGYIAVIEIPKGLEKYEKAIAQTLLEVSPSIITVVKKVGGHSGTYRRQKMRVLAGKRNKMTIHSENSIRLKIHVENTYFSPRTATERARIASLVREGERVLVMFSGVAPFPLTIGKGGRASLIVGVESNPKAHDLALENLSLNKKAALNIILHNGDARTVLTKEYLGQTFDRIIMPLPKGASGYLDVALEHAHQGSIIHIYTFAKEDDIQQAGKRMVEEVSNHGRSGHLLSAVKCGQSGVREYRVCVDMRIED